MQKKPDPTFIAQLKSSRACESPHELAAAIKTHDDGLALLQAIIDQKLLPKDDACRLYAASLGLAYVDPFASIITEEATAALPAEIAKKAGVIGLYVIDGVLTAAFSRPDDHALVRRVGQVARMTVSPVFAAPRDIEEAIHIQYSNEKSIEESIGELERSTLFDDPDLASDKIAVLADTSAVAGLIEEIIHYAIRERATDIHIEPQLSVARVRFRIDGMLREILTYPRKMHRAFVSRLKIVSNLNIAETRFPQDGRFSLGIGANRADFRFSSVPAQHGEKVVIRLLGGGRRSLLSLDKMMMSKTVLEPFRRLVRSPNGILFVTGPTGSGKTTTLYAALNEINGPDINISTIEDPIEIQLPGVTQIQVNSHIDLKFSTILRSLLRQDPDAILIGEIRDLETAKIATEAALTGHIVFATLHTNTAAQAIVRLLEIGVEPYMVAPAVIGVLAQRLAARICESCKEAYVPTPETLSRYFREERHPDIQFYRGRGCPSCRGTGYKGRVAFHELVIVTDEVRTLITKGASVQEITAAAAKVGYQPLRYDGLKKVLLGLTTIEEIEANTSLEFSG